MTIPEWLPDMLEIDPWTGETYEFLYEHVFKRDFIDSKPQYFKRTVWFFPEVEDGKEKLFWHLTSRKNPEDGIRYPDLRRCERLSWTRPMIDRCPDVVMLNWDHEEGDGVIKTYVWLTGHDFVVIMKRYKDKSRRLITSYYLDNAHQRRKMTRKYERRIVD